MVRLCRCKGALTAGSHTVQDLLGPSTPQLFVGVEGKDCGTAFFKWKTHMEI